MKNPVLSSGVKIPAGAMRQAEVPVFHEALAAATHAARLGRYVRAEKLLSSLPEEIRLKPGVLDLRAKICAQRGFFLDAETYWREALEQEPENHAYREGLATLRRGRGLPGRIGPAAFVVLWLVFGWFFQSRWLDQRARIEVLGVQLLAGFEATGERDRQVREILTSLEALVPALDRRMEQELRALEKRERTRAADGAETRRRDFQRLLQGTLKNREILSATLAEIAAQGHRSDRVSEQIEQLSIHFADQQETLAKLLQRLQPLYLGYGAKP